MMMMIMNQVDHRVVVVYIICTLHALTGGIINLLGNALFSRFHAFHVHTGDATFVFVFVIDPTN